MLLAFLGAIAYSGFVMGWQPPGHSEHVDPARLAEDPHFGQPSVKEVAPGRYEAYVVARAWSFHPGDIRIPKGSTVSFRVTSADVTHGFEIVGTNVNVMIVPGFVTQVEQRFDQPGQYLILCNEYCGAGHHFMQARIIVEED